MNKKITLLSIILTITITSCDVEEGPFITDYDIYVNPNKKVLIEDFTGHKCPNCPDAAKELEAIQGVIDKDMYTMGESVKQFESDFSNFMNTKYSVMVSSGSTANLLAVAALFFTKDIGLKRGDEVIVPAVSWSTTYFPLQQYGLKLKFVDIDL